MRRRSFLSLAGLAALTSACSGTERQGTPPPSTAYLAGPSRTVKPKIPLQQWYHAYESGDLQNAVKRYASGYSAAKVKVVWNAGDYDATIAGALQNGGAPDVFEAKLKLDWVRQNQVVALDDVIGAAKDDFLPAALAQQTVEGKVYGVPQAVDTQVLCYRKSMLQAAGVQPPQSLDELIDAAGKLTKDGVKGLFAGNDFGAAALTGPLLWSAGLDYLKPGEHQVGFDDPRAAVVFGKLHTLNANGSLLLGAPADWPDPGAFVNGLAAMQWTGLTNLPRIQSAFGDDYGVLPFPRLDATGVPSVPVSGYGAMVNVKGPHVAEAKAFVKWLWLERTDHQLEFATQFGFHLPARQSLIARAETLASGPAADAARFVRENGRLADGGPVWTVAADTALHDVVTKIVRDGADPVAMTKAAVDVANSELKRFFG